MGASFILAINIALASAIMVAFLAFGFYDRTQKAVFWWFGACLAGLLSGAVEYGLPSAESTAFARFLIFSFFAISVACLSIGLALRYVGRIPWMPIGIVLLAGLGSYLATSEMPRDSLMRNIGYQGPYIALQCVGIHYVLKGMTRTLVDRAVLAGICLNAAQFAVRPVMVGFFGGNGETAQAYLSTDYAMASQTLMAISTILIALILGIRTLTDIITGIQLRSQIDVLSGMLNRDAFQRQADLTVTRDTGGLSRALVICDLDHFKTINDTYGHPVGDIVIAAFGRLIEEKKRSTDLSGRVGGEEFCILLRNCDASGARLFAEHLREAFLNQRFDLADTQRSFTASFGVTELLPGEHFDEAFSRADEALYAAKRAGRNRVCTVLESGLAMTSRSAAIKRMMDGGAVHRFG